jgi:lactate dehydrogenase-like 2-hydroxyacid dehydrogenase
MKITLTRLFPSQIHETLRGHYDDWHYPKSDKPLPRKEFLEQLSSTEVLLCSPADKLDKEALENAPLLKAVITYSVGVDHLDLKILKKRNITVSHTPDVLTDATADLAFTLMLASARRIKPALRFMEEGKFEGASPTLFLGKELKDSILGIVGLGRIGKAVAKRANAFGLQVFYNGGNNEGLSFSSEPLPLAQLLKAADILSLHCPLTEKNLHLIGRKELSLMKPDAVLINTARGALLDEAALIAHLRTHPDFYAGLDVFEKEPFYNPILNELPNALCTPHIGSATEKARFKMAQMCLEEAIRFSRGEPLKHTV